MAIKIVFYSEVIDNLGRTKSSTKGADIFNVLNDVEEWTDDMTFKDENGQMYFIDDLAGKEVWVADIGLFTVPAE
jgi:hypothetical protein